MDKDYFDKLYDDIQAEFGSIFKLDEQTDERLLFNLSHDDYTVAFVIDIDTETSDIDLWLDYPEDGILLDVDQIAGSRMTDQLQYCETKAERLASSFRQDRNIVEFIQNLISN
ncbi:MAG: hypothetical protein ACOX2M_03545 [Fastidiosipilaceae bacterium]|jgi:hypothetical protein